MTAVKGSKIAALLLGAMLAAHFSSHADLAFPPAPGFAVCPNCPLSYQPAWRDAFTLLLSAIDADSDPSECFSVFFNNFEHSHESALLHESSNARCAADSSGCTSAFIMEAMRTKSPLFVFDLFVALWPVSPMLSRMIPDAAFAGVPRDIRLDALADIPTGIRREHLKEMVRIQATFPDRQACEAVDMESEMREKFGRKRADASETS
ncbi:hypothetical protein H9P43_009022 [Blastocladiella emersonii ATCC 22665]|nr:hypothetical protein H9P43_009022 [Blastocladiella emersonii ATCC 22665]